MSGVNADGLPGFERPPVIETILGVHFEPIRDLRGVYLGLFWRHLRREQWPDVRELTPISSQIEQFDVSPTAPFRFALTETKQPQTRVRLDSQSRREVIQLQSNLLQTHWTRNGDAGYPRYPQVKATFQETWAAFIRFLANENLPAPKPVQWEVTYINSIPAGDLWRTPADWPSVFNGVLVPPRVPDGSIESAMVRYHYRLNGDRKRLHVEVRHVSESGDAAQSLNVTLTARGSLLDAVVSIGKTTSPMEQRIEPGLDFGRQAIVRGFTTMLSQRSLEYFGHRQEGFDA